MAFTAADLAAIDSAIAKGESSVTFADRRVDYRSIEELLRARAAIAGAVARAATTPRPKYFLASSEKGY